MGSATLSNIFVFLSANLHLATCVFQCIERYIVLEIN